MKLENVNQAVDELKKAVVSLQKSQEFLVAAGVDLEEDKKVLSHWAQTVEDLSKEVSFIEKCLQTLKNNSQG